MQTRRLFLSTLGAALVAAPISAHTPYGQWVVYRRKHLIVGSHRGDLQTYALAQELVAGLNRELPEAQARVARGPRPQRIASLIGTGQIFLAVMSADEAQRMAEAQAPFEGYRKTPVHTLGYIGDGYALFAAPEFPENHARLVTGALDHEGLIAPADHMAFPRHVGSASYWDSFG